MYDSSMTYVDPSQNNFFVSDASSSIDSLSQDDLFLILLYHELWAFIKDIRYLLIDGLKLEKES